MTPRKIATIRDVAAAAGVSIATVSKYVNRQQSFSPAVEEKLKAAIAELGYSQNPAARSMVTGRTWAVGIAVMDIRNPHYANIVKGANRIGLAGGYSQFVVDIEERREGVRPLLDSLARRVDGLIVSTRIPADDIDWLVTSGKPVVFIGLPTRSDMVTVRTDGYAGATQLAHYLVQQGYRRIAYAGYAPASWNEERAGGLREVLEAAGLQLKMLEVDGTATDAGQRAAARLLLSGERPDAIVACNDQVAIGLMLQARTLGISIPEDVALASFDNIPPSGYVTPPLTTVDMQSEKMGEAAMQQLLALISGKTVTPDFRLEPNLVIRASTNRRTL